MYRVSEKALVQSWIRAFVLSGELFIFRYKYVLTLRQLTLKLPDDLHTKLKIKCVKIKKTMGEVLIDLIREYVK